jgi:hypothetical protein
VRTRCYATARAQRAWDCVSLAIHNCTFYLSTWAGYALFSNDNSGARQSGITNKNCILCSPDAGAYMPDVRDATGVTIDYNLYDRPDDANARWRYLLVLYTWTQSDWCRQLRRLRSRPRPLPRSLGRLWGWLVLM